ncbi:MAG TPA: glycine oxidase ThiO [Rhizomicrobium sp.]|jgi:glycine oxidase|nr:glycine oxidase ThiO [Rhizomicrobium sp.]
MRVVIVGAGIAGLSIGWRLRQRGAEVTILERGQPAMAATWAAAGMIAAAGEMGELQTPEAEFGRYSSSLWPDFAKEIEAASGHAIDFRRNGALMVLSKDALASHPDALTPSAARAREPMLTPAIPGAFWMPDESQVDARALGPALAAAFVRAGGVLSVNEAAVRFTVHEDRVIALHTAFAFYEADVFILAAGAWSGEFGGLPPEALPPIRPVKGEMIAVAPPAGDRVPTSVIWGNEVYLVPRTGRLLIGATAAEAGFDTSVTDAAAAWLSSRALGLMPGLATWQVVERWAGLRPATPDGAPVLGPTSLGRLFVASGQYRNGILFAPAVAETLARLVLEHAAVPPAFDPRRFQRGQGT